MPSVGLFLNQHLPLSEVFIAHQAQSLTRYQPQLIACRGVTPSAQHNLPTFVLNKNNSLPEKIEETVFKLTGHSRRLTQECARHDILHAHFGPVGWLAAPFAKRTQKPLIVTLHGFDVLKDHIRLKNDGLVQYLYARNLRRLTETADMFLCVSDFLRQKAIAFGIPEDKCVVHYMGIPLLPHPELKYIRDDNNTNPFRILAVGRLVPMKGHAKLIEAISAVEAEGYKVHLDIVGGGALRDSLETLAKQKLTSYTFWGAQPHEIIRTLMRQGDIFCHMSETVDNGYTEAFGLVVLEAQWAGLPVITTNTGGVPEALSDGKTGIICPEGDIRAYKDAIIKLITDTALRQAMAQEAPLFVQRHFDNQQQTVKLESLYDSVLAKRQGRPNA